MDKTLKPTNSILRLKTRHKLFIFYSNIIENNDVNAIYLKYL